MPISDDAARAEHIRSIAEILARGLDRLFNSRDSVSQSPTDALSFRDKPCSVSSTLVNGSGAREKENDDVWFALVALLTIGAGTR